MKYLLLLLICLCSISILSADDQTAVSPTEKYHADKLYTSDIAESFEKLEEMLEDDYYIVMVSAEGESKKGYSVCEVAASGSMLTIKLVSLEDEDLFHAETIRGKDVKKFIMKKIPFFKDEK